MHETIRSQLTFSGKSDCERYEPNPFLKTASKCKHCMCPLIAHRSEAVSDEDILLHLKVEAGKEGTEILRHDGGGHLYLGGSGASSPSFVEKKYISKVVICAVNSIGVVLLIF